VQTPKTNEWGRARAAARARHIYVLGLDLSIFKMDEIHRIAQVRSDETLLANFVVVAGNDGLCGFALVGKNTAMPVDSR
jgi:hypothetical protein